MMNFKEFSGIKLWLDDERNPEDPSIQTWFGSTGDEVWVKTVKDAIAILKGGNVVSVAFDHDLGTLETGYDLAVWIEKQAHNKTLPKLKWTVHSINPMGANKIKQAMQQADKYWDE